MAEDTKLPITPSADPHRSAMIAMVVIFLVALLGGTAALAAFF
jgi:hypothetical protein